MWTRPQIKDFKEKIRQDADSVITVRRGEVVTVRVPTHEEGSYLFWEFATDSYDIGFGVYFEWTDSPNAAVSVHVSESSDDDEEEEGRALSICSNYWVYFLQNTLGWGYSIQEWDIHWKTNLSRRRLWAWISLNARKICLAVCYFTTSWVVFYLQPCALTSWMYEIILRFVVYFV